MNEEYTRVTSPEDQPKEIGNYVILAPKYASIPMIATFNKDKIWIDPHFGPSDDITQYVCAYAKLPNKLPVDIAKMWDKPENEYTSYEDGTVGQE